MIMREIIENVKKEFKHHRFKILTVLIQKRFLSCTFTISPLLLQNNEVYF